MYSATALIHSIGPHVLLPGIICVVIASLLLSWWEFQRLTSTGRRAANRWLPAVAITAGVISFLLIAARFIWIA